MQPGYNSVVGLLELVMISQRIYIWRWRDLKIFWAKHRMPKNVALREEKLYFTQVSLWTMNIISLTKCRLNHMNKGYNSSFLCVVIVSTCVGDSWDKLLGPPTMKVVITIAKFCMMLVSGLSEFIIFEIMLSIFHGNWRLCGYSKDKITSYIVSTMSHWLFAKLLSFTSS